MLKEFRKSKGWTLDEAALALGLSKSYLSELETGARGWTLKAARRVEQRTDGALKAAELLGFSQQGAA
jgi:transcriptional regulator with XRE-family HTH domain